ncbi:uncharacterized protein LOC143102251 [Alosa pseudoharengus]|uniref:uncharacterized protein LOC143102251 n=1 Tax=Alosa pseudoharengus TaxID=34774 RepID=UPI003F8B96EC
MESEQKVRKDLEQTLGHYISDTFVYIYTLRQFCDTADKWCLQRETEVDTMTDIKDRADQIDAKFEDVKKSKEKAKAFKKYLWRGLTAMTADSKRQELEKELGAVLKDTLEGLEKLQRFLEAVEKLAVTSLFVFTDGRYLPKGVNAADVRSVIFAARMAAPLLVHFKRDASFFLPSLNNVDVLALQLEKYIHISQQLCERIRERLKNKFYTGDGNRKSNDEFHLPVDTSEVSIQMMLNHVDQLNYIRRNQDIRLTFLFHEAALTFIGLFCQRHDRMRQFLCDLTASADQLDRMKLGASISSVAGSSVGVAGGALSIAGLALAPMTAGVSLILTMTGVGLGVASGVNSLATGITGMVVNSKHSKQANGIFQSFMEDVQSILDCVEHVASHTGPIVEPGKAEVLLGTGRVVAKVFGLGKGIDALVDGASALKVIGSKQVATGATKVGLKEVKSTKNFQNLAADASDLGQLAKGTPLALSSSARSGFMALNSLFIGLDIFFIYKDGTSLARGSRSKVAQLIRSRTALWRSELDSWENMHDSLCRGIWRFRRSWRILETPFYPKQLS